MANAINDGLNKPSIAESVNAHVFDFGIVTGSGNTSVVTYSRSFTSGTNNPVVTVAYQLGSLAVASYPVLSSVNSGSFSIAGGSNLPFVWQAVGSGTY